MSWVSFIPHPLELLMPHAVKTAQEQVCGHLIKAGLAEFAEERPNGRIADQFDQRLVADWLDAFRIETLGSMRKDAKAGCQLIRVTYHDRLDQFGNGALDPNTATVADRRWVARMQVEPLLVGVWGLSYPILVHYLDGTARWESRCDAIVSVKSEYPWTAKPVVQAQLSAGSSPHAPAWAWAGQIRTANTDFAQVFGPLQWNGGAGANWNRLTQVKSRPSCEGLKGANRAKLLVALSQVSMAERVIRLHQSRGAD